MTRMKIIESVNEKPLAISIGKFEGLHLGHARLINATREHARERDLFTAVLSFVPHPIKVLADKGYKTMFSTAEQSFLLGKYDIDYWIPYPFDRELARMTPGEFCRLLKSELNCHALLVGEGFHFGRNREGDQGTLQVLGRELGIDVITVPTLQLEDEEKTEKISTSEIRLHLAKGEMRETAKLLGRSFFVMGEVSRQFDEGRGVTVAADEDKLLPPMGDYLANVVFVGGKAGVLEGVATIGDSSMVDVCLSGFSGDISGEILIVELVEAIF